MVSYESLPYATIQAQSCASETLLNTFLHPTSSHVPYLENSSTSAALTAWTTYRIGKLSSSSSCSSPLPIHKLTKWQENWQRHNVLLNSEESLVKDAYSKARAAHTLAYTKWSNSGTTVRAAREIQLAALSSNGMSPHALMEINLSLKKSERKMQKCAEEQQSAKQRLLQSIIAYDERTSAMKRVHEVLERERRHVLKNVLEDCVALEMEQLARRQMALATLADNVAAMDAEADVVAFISEKSQSSLNVHELQGKALTLLDWQWKSRNEDECEDFSFPREEHDVHSQVGDEDHLSMQLFVNASFLGKQYLEIHNSRPSFDTKKGRKWFLHCLNQKRSEQRWMNENAYQTMSIQMECVLNECVKTNDIKSAKNLMILAETFYRISIQDDQSEKRIFLQEAIQQHPLWQNIKVFV